MITADIKAEALRLGFDVCGIAKAEPVPLYLQQAYTRWIAQGQHGNMDYLARNLDKRFDPTLLVEGVKSIVCVAMNYYPVTELDADTYQLAWYAYGKDYHEVLKEKMVTLFATLKERYPQLEGRCFCDTAPVLERYWAQQAGLGWRGKSTQLIIPHHGTSFFLGELFLNVELDYDKPTENHCGTCMACHEQCPAQALYMDAETGLGFLNANRCLSYQTIENRGELSQEAQQSMGTSIYGCDQCQKACPNNRFAQPNTHAEFQPSEELRQMKRSDWEKLSVEQYRILFKGSAVKRAKYEGLIRNIKAASKK